MTGVQKPTAVTYAAATERARQAEEVAAARARLQAIVDRVAAREAERLAAVTDQVADLGLQTEWHTGAIEVLQNKVAAVFDALEAMCSAAGMPVAEPPRGRHLRLVRAGEGDGAA